MGKLTFQNLFQKARNHPSFKQLSVKRNCIAIADAAVFKNDFPKAAETKGLEPIAIAGNYLESVKWGETPKSIFERFTGYYWFNSC